MDIEKMFSIRDTEYEKIPNRTMFALRRYVTIRMAPGHFVTECLENKFAHAVCRADNDNLHAIHEIALFLFNRLPSSCWGSHEKVRAWLEGGEEDD